MIGEIAVITAFFTSLFGVPVAERYLAASGIYSRDQQKQGKPRIPTSGGIPVFFSLAFGISVYIGLGKLMGINTGTESMLAALSSTAMIALIGLIDDIHIDLRGLLQVEEVDLNIETGDTVIHRSADRFLGEIHPEEHTRGISQLPKALLVVPAALPLIAIGAGSWTMKFPVIGTVNWGVVYPLLLLPVGLVFVANAINILAGVNGLEASLSLVAATALGVYGFLNGATQAYILAFIFAASLVGFLVYNFYPSSILPGDSLTYGSGAVLFTVIVLGNMEKFAVMLFAPWILEFVLKARSGFDADSWGVLQEDGSLKPKYERNYSLTHPFMRRGLTEKQVFYALTASVAAWAAVTLITFTQVTALTA